MRIAIIGAGNMGGAIARGLAQVEQEEISLMVSNPSRHKLDALQKDFPLIETTTDNQEAILEADIIILAVKPWLIKSVLSALKVKSDQIVASVAAGVEFASLSKYIGPEVPLFRIIPNTAIAQQESMTLISSSLASKEQEKTIIRLFNYLGRAIIISEELLAAGTAIASCGIAYAFKYIQASMQAAVELGLRPAEAQFMIAQTVKGAAEVLLNPANSPALEIDKVTTPGGVTIKGVNELDHQGFSSAIIKAIKASC